MKQLLLIPVALLGAAFAVVVAQAGATKTTVTINESEFKLTPSTRHVAPGAVRFVVRNKGTMPHAFRIAGPGVVKKTAIIQAGTSATLTVVVRRGTYTLTCPLPGHAQLGMKATLVVGSGASTGSTTGPATTDQTTTTTIPGY